MVLLLLLRLMLRLWLLLMLLLLLVVRERERASNPAALELQLCRGRDPGRRVRLPGRASDLLQQRLNVGGHGLKKDRLVLPGHLQLNPEN